MNALAASQIWERAAEPARRLAAKARDGMASAVSALAGQLSDLHALAFALTVVDAKLAAAIRAEVSGLDAIARRA